LEVNLLAQYQDIAHAVVEQAARRNPMDTALAERLMRAYFGPSVTAYSLTPEKLAEALAFLERCHDEMVLREIEEDLTRNKVRPH
jgi:hypothetical protein